MGRLIDEDDVIDALVKKTGLDWEYLRIIEPICKVIENVPTAEPTLYGYNINHLAFIVGIMIKKGITAEEAIEIFKDAERLFQLVYDDVQETFKMTVEKAMMGWED